MTNVRPAGPQDARRLSQLGASTFRDTFGDANRPEDIDRFVADAFNPERQAAEIADPAGLVLLAEHTASDGAVELIGYAHLVRQSPPPGVTGPAPVELKRLYVEHAWHGQGAAQRLMDAVLEGARSWGAGTLWLGVWERNPRAVAFYEKYGFRRVGEHTFMLGDEAQTDWLLARPIDEAAPDSRPTG
jgi:diamine N-acetyltransferase